MSAFETREVLDRLLLDLGFRSDRKAMMVPEGVWLRGRKKLFAEWFSSYGTEEYRGVLGEYLEIMGRSRKIHWVVVEGTILSRTYVSINRIPGAFSPSLKTTSRFQPYFLPPLS